MKFLKPFFLTLILLLMTITDGAPNAKKISFNYDNEDLVNVINYIASQKNINVILPMQADKKITGKFTWHLDKKVTLDEAWELLGTILQIAGYSIVPKADFYEIVKTNKEVVREPMPIHIGTDPEQLPMDDQRIRYIYYFSNIKLQPGEGRDSEINTVLKALLPENSSYQLEIASNAILMMAPSSDIRSIMSVIVQLDRPGFQEQLEIFPLRFTTARIVADLFNKKILQTGEQDRYHLGPKKSTEANYFSKHLRMIANDRTNTIIMIGRSQAIERAKDFIARYIDVKPDSGESILHVYQLQYLDAPSFAEVLNNIVKSRIATEAPAQATGQKKAAGPERYFEGVLVAVDTPKKEGFAEELPAPAEGESAKLPPPKYYGGNNLVIAARSDDWKRIRKLIEELDQPSPQVLIEVLIADLTLNDQRALGNMIRNAAKLPMPGEFNFQSAQLSPGVVPDSFDNPNTIGAIQTDEGMVKYVADENRLFTVNEDGTRSDATPATEGATSVVAGLTPGTTAITLNDADGATWNITRILKVLDATKILSHPHVISTNNQEAKIEDTQIRLLPGETTTGTGGATVRKQEQVKASLKVAIRPRISPAREEEGEVGTINLQVIVDIDEYTSATENTRFQRNVTTNATVNSGGILAIGGLLRTEENNSIDETPLLSKIPLIGWLFKNKSKSNRRNNLTVFISPTIIEPRLRGGVGEYTQDYLALQKSYSKGNLFESLKDPITRWFFHTKSPTEKFSNEFMEHDEVHSDKRAKVPMPQPLNDNSSNRKKGAISEIAQNKKDQTEAIKGLLQQIDNPFDSNKNATTVTQKDLTPQPEVRPRF